MPDTRIKTGAVHVEVSQVRKRLQQAIGARASAPSSGGSGPPTRERAYATFLETIGVPVARQVANALKAEGYAFTVFTPGDGLRLAEDRGRDDFVELALDTTGERPAGHRPHQPHARLAHDRRRAAGEGETPRPTPHRRRRAGVLARRAGAAGWSARSPCGAAGAPRASPSIRTAPGAPGRRGSRAVPSCRATPSARRDSCGSTRECSDRCRVAGAARRPSADPTTVR